MKRAFAIAIIGLLAGCGLRQPFEAEFGLPLPEGVVIADSAHVQHGPDTSHFFRLTHWQDDDLSNIVSRSRLERWTGEPSALIPVNVPGPSPSKLPAWWDRDTLLVLPEIYGRVDKSTERFWWVFVDRARSELLVNSGEW
jgi:hypothetical protein